MNFFTLNNTKEIFNLLEATQGIEQDPKWHPEIDVFNHSLQVVNLAFRESNDIDLILAALLHDVGKAEIKLGHDERGCKLLEGLVSIKTLFLIEHHLRIWNYLDGSMKKLSKLKFLIEHPWLPELIQLARWDKKGRIANKKIDYDREIIINRFNMKIDNRFKGEIL